MTQRIEIHPQNPQPRLLEKVAAVIRKGGVIAYPTDSGYALGCALDNKSAVDRIRQIRRLDKQHHFTLMCPSLAELSLFARVDNPTFRLLKACTPGAYTFILPATKAVPKRLVHPGKKTIGLRVPDHQVVLSLLAILGEPIMSVSLVLPEYDEPLIDPDDVCARLKNQVDVVLDTGMVDHQLTTVVDCSQGRPEIIRRGKGDVSVFE